MPVETVLIALVLIAGFYMAWNIGANDVANAMGTSVGSGALTLSQAVMLAAILEFAGAFFFGSHVSDTIQTGVVDPEYFAEQPRIFVYGMLSALIASGLWLQIASYYGWPVSTTHSIIGSLIGFGSVLGGVYAVRWENVSFIVFSWIVSPLLGGLLAYYLFTFLRNRIFYSSQPLESAKRLTPILVFIVFFILSLVTLFKGLQNIGLDFSFTNASILSLCVGLIGAMISHFLVQRIVNPLSVIVQHRNKPEITMNLDQVRKHLQRVQANSWGDVQYQVSLMIAEVETITYDVRQTEDSEGIKAEYAAVEKIFSYLQIITACLMAFAHGANDVANAIGPLAAAISVLSTHSVAYTATVPVWALALGGIGIVSGLATWGWRVIETIGRKITELTPSRGFAAEFGAATTVVLASRLGLPISTTHTLVGAVVGVGLARGIEALDLTMTRDIVISWVVTVPMGAFLSVLIFYTLQAIFG